MQKTICVLLMIGAAGWTQQHESLRPDFKDFLVEQVYAGDPVPPKLTRPQRTFRTIIREGAKSPVEFAGHYTVPRWGCGAGCVAFVIVDSITGRVFDGFGVAGLPQSWEKSTKSKCELSSIPRVV